MRRWVAVALAAVAASSVAVAHAASSAIPGVRATDVTRSLVPQDFECAGPARVKGLATWTCTKNLSGASYAVTVAGTSAKQVTTIRAVATIKKGKVDPLARTFVGYIATVPYSGSSPTKAQAWAMKHVAGGTIRFGRVKFTISAAGNKRMLELKG